MACKTTPAVSVPVRTRAGCAAVQAALFRLTKHAATHVHHVVADLIAPMWHTLLCRWHESVLSCGGAADAAAAEALVSLLRTTVLPTSVRNSTLLAGGMDVFPGALLFVQCAVCSVCVCVCVCVCFHVQESH